MAVKSFSAGKVDILTQARVNGRYIPKQISELPGGLYPMRMAYWETDPYRIANGWPTAEPAYDIHASTKIVATGEVLAYREQARGVETGAPVRWIADDDLYDTTVLRWGPYQSEMAINWITSPEYAPTYIDDYEYVVNEESFTAAALNFDADSFEHMWADLGPMLAGASGYSVVMCLSLNSVYGNNLAVPYSGLWCPGTPTPAPGQAMVEKPNGGWISLTLQGTSLYLETDQSKRTNVLSVSDLLSSTAPIMIGMTVGRPYTTIYAGRGPSNIRRASVNIGDQVVPLDSRVVLGRTNGNILHTADMAMLDLGIYPDRLSAQEMKSEFATLSSVYGSDK